MALYGVTRTQSSISTVADSITIVASSTKPLRIYTVSAGGMGTSSAANEIMIARSTAGTTPGGGITPAKYDPGTASASFSAYTTWVAQPTIAATDIIERLTVNANGGKDKFVALPGGEIQVAAGGQVSIRSAVGTSSITFSLLVEEVG